MGGPHGHELARRPGEVRPPHNFTPPKARHIITAECVPGEWQPLFQRKGIAWEPIRPGCPVSLESHLSTRLDGLIYVCVRVFV